MDDDYDADYDTAEYNYDDGGVLFVQAADWDEVKGDTAESKPYSS
jgi:hypothetical protein